MKKKIVGIIICIMLFSPILLTVIGTSNANQQYEPELKILEIHTRIPGWGEYQPGCFYINYGNVGDTDVYDVTLTYFVLPKKGFAIPLRHLHHKWEIYQDKPFRAGKAPTCISYPIFGLGTFKITAKISSPNTNTDTKTVTANIFLGRITIRR